MCLNDLQILYPKVVLPYWDYVKSTNQMVPTGFFCTPWKAGSKMYREAGILRRPFFPASWGNPFSPHLILHHLGTMTYYPCAMC